MLFRKIVLVEESIDIFDELKERIGRQSVFCLCQSRSLSTSTHEVPEVIECACSFFDVSQRLLQSPDLAVCSYEVPL